MRGVAAARNTAPCRCLGGRRLPAHSLRLKAHSGAECAKDTEPAEHIVWRSKDEPQDDEHRQKPEWLLLAHVCRNGRFFGR